MVPLVLIQNVKTMLDVDKTIKIFPLCYVLGNESVYLKNSTDWLNSEGIENNIINTNYEFQKGADSRSENYIIIEIIIFKGRSQKTKSQLIKLVYKNIYDIGIKATDLEITIIEEPLENWGIRGFLGNELKINFKVEI